MKDIIFQEQYFLYYLTKFPLITYDEILKLFIQTYPKVEIKFTNKQYHNLKAKIKSDQINVNNDIDIIDNLQFLETKMLKTYIKFLNEDNEYSEIRIFGTEETFSYLRNKEIKQYFIDGTYKVLPNIENIKVLVLIIGNRGYTNDNVLCCSVLMSDEREETFKRLLNELKVYFDFFPEFITTDFSISNINAIEKVFKDDNVKLITCFFHLVQAWWRKANQLGLRRNEIKEKTKFLINNLKLCAFMSFEEATKYYNMIKNHNDLKDERFELFFEYLDTTWFGFEEKKRNKIIYKSGKYPFELWNYYDKLKLNNVHNDCENDNKENKIEKYLSYTNNNVESINSYIKSQIPFGKKVTPNVFNKIIKKLFLRYKNKRKKMKLI